MIDTALAPEVPEHIRRLAHQRLQSPPGSETREQYHRVLARIARKNESMADLETRPQYDLTRAALTFAAAEHILEMEEVLCARQGPPSPSERKDLSDCAQILCAYPPADAPISADTGSSTRAAFRKPESASQRHRLRKLKRQPLFGPANVFAHIQARGRCVLACAVSMTAGPRPSELHKGVDVRLLGTEAAPLLVLTIYGSKVRDGCSGYTWRQVAVDAPWAHPVTACLLDAARANGGGLIVQESPDRLRRAMARGARDLLGPKGAWVTPYVWRHAVATRVRADAGLVAAAQVLGHTDVNSTRGYRGGHDGGPLVWCWALSGPGPKNRPRSGPPVFDTATPQPAPRV